MYGINIMGKLLQIKSQALESKTAEPGTKGCYSFSPLTLDELTSLNLSVPVCKVRIVVPTYRSPAGFT